MVTTASVLNVALLAQAALAQNAFKHQHLGYTPANIPGVNMFATSAGCDPGYVVCRTGCMPSGSVCCPTHGYCDKGEVCQGDLCCPQGKTCTGTGTCDPGERKCGKGCVSTAKVCCPFANGGAGGSCDLGETCQSDNTCKKSGSSSGGGSSGGGSSGGGSSSSCNAAQVACDNKCMPIGAQCCKAGDGGYCRVGTYCDEWGGCCLNGQKCKKGDWDESDTTATGTGITIPPATTRATTPRSSPTTAAGSDDDDASSDDDDATSTTSRRIASGTTTSSSASAATSPTRTTPTVGGGSSSTNPPTNGARVLAPFSWAGVAFVAALASLPVFA